MSSIPTLIQHVASAANPVGAGLSGNAFVFYLPNSVGAGNCLSWDHIRRRPNCFSISDTINGAWPAAAITGSDTNNIAIYVLPNASAGVTQVTITFSNSVNTFQYTISEFNNIATVSPVSGSSSFVLNNQGPNLICG